MLSAREDAVLTAVLHFCGGKDCTLITPQDLLASLKKREGFTEDRLERVLSALEMDDYLDIVYSDRKGERVYCVTLHAKGQGYFRSKQVQKRNLFFRIGVTVALAAVSFVIGLILRAIFT